MIDFFIFSNKTILSCFYCRMVVTCYVQGCLSGNDPREKIHFFKPNETNLNQWQQLIGRKDVKLNKKHSVCQKHFEEDQIIKQKIFNGVDGPIIVYDLCRWKLTEGALPKLLTGQIQKRILSVSNDDEVTVLREVRNAIQQEHHPSVASTFIINHKKVALPSSWFWQEGSFKEQEFICSKFKWLNENKFEYTKTVIINGDTRTLRYFIRGQQIFHEKLKYHFSTVNELTSFLKLFDDAQVCNDYTGLNGLLNQESNTSKKSIPAPPTKQNVVESRFESTFLEKLSHPPKKTYSNVQPSQATSKLQNLNPGNKDSDNLVEPVVTSVLIDHAYGVGTNLPLLIPMCPEIICEKISTIMNTFTDHIPSPIVSQSEYELQRLPQVVPESQLDLQTIEDRDSVTLQYPIEFYTSSVSSLQEHEQMLVKRTEFFQYSTYNLISYHLETWCLGVYSPFKPDTVSSSFIQFFNPHKEILKKTLVERPLIENNCISFSQPSFLVEQPKQVYCRREVIPRSSSKEVKKTNLTMADIEHLKFHNGKLHVTSNGESGVQLSLSSLFEDESNYVHYQPNETNQPPESNQPIVESSIPRTARKRVRSSCFFLDTESEIDENDKKDLELARRFLGIEVRRRKTLQKKCQRFSGRVERNKKMARSLLKAVEEFELRKWENAIVNQPKRTHGSKKPGAQMPCNQCGKIILVSRMKYHLKIHSGHKPYLCELCGRAFVFRKSLNTHIRYNHLGQERPKHFMCSTCGHTCTSRNHLEKHERIHTDERPFECKYCDKKFREKGTLVRHIRTHTGEKPYPCNICGTSYGARETYVSHYRRKHENKRPATDPQKTQTRVRRSIRSYRCEFCQKVFFRVLAYEKHRATHTGVAAAIKCNQPNCDFTYSDMMQLKDHMITQHPEKAYTCDICKKVFLSKLNLTLHQSVHDPALGFQCSYCPVRLTAKTSLVAHEKLHTRETPHECTFCEMRFHSTYLLQIHVRTHQPSQVKRKRYRKKKVEK